MICLRAGSAAVEWLAAMPDEGFHEFYLQPVPRVLLRVSLIHGNVGISKKGGSNPRAWPSRIEKREKRG
jgi:hypothetical protein